MNSIGGFFSLELPYHEEYHQNVLRFNSGRNCLEYILLTRKYKKVYIPYYTCDAILEPIKKLGVKYEYYHIDLSFELLDEILLQRDEALLYTNYFGLKQQYADYLIGKYGNHIIIDNTQAFFEKPEKGIDTFYSCRKFFGVSDGAYLYTSANLNKPFAQDLSFERMSYLMKRIDLSAEAGFEDFHKADDGLAHQPIRKMSKLTQRIMQSIDYRSVTEQRRNNFLMLHSTLSATNKLNISLDKDAVPMVYPYLTDREGLRDHLIKEKIYVARYWPNVLEWTTADSLEWYLTRQMIPLPIDQRYGKNEMNRIINCIQ